MRVLEPASLSLLTDRRRHGPHGVDGGEPGRVGRNLLGGEELPPKVSRELEEGDVVTVETPGGGGYGHAGGALTANLFPRSTYRRERRMKRCSRGIYVGEGSAAMERVEEVRTIEGWHRGTATVRRQVLDALWRRL